MFIRTCMQGPPIPDRFLWQIPDDEHGRRRLLDGACWILHLMDQAMNVQRGGGGRLAFIWGRVWFVW
jgi:hypothetical protein